MGFINKAASILRFDTGDRRFELLEREEGSPNLFMGWNDVAPNTQIPQKTFHTSVDKNEKLIRKLFSSDVNTDLIIRRFETSNCTRMMLVYMNGMARDETIARFVLSPLMNLHEKYPNDPKFILESVIEIPESSTEKEPQKILKAILNGKTALFIDGSKECVVLETRGYEKRAVAQTENEKIVRGPKEGFNENLRTNITLIRRIVRTRDLIAEYIEDPGENGTDIALVYRGGFTNKALVNEVRKRLKRINTKALSSTGIVEQLIEDDPYSPLPQALSTERPDRVASFLMQGAAAVLAEGSPYALVMPVTLSALLSSPEDAYMRRPLGTVIRIVRYIGAFTSIIFPGYFVALAMYHQGLLSTEVLSTVIKSREMVFEPLPFEMILLLFIFQLIREAGMRVPSSVGQAIGVIGGLILGQAAVAANLASTVILIIVAISGLGNLCIPDYSTQVAASYFRFAFVIAAWMGGLLGLCSAFIVFVAYLVNLKSFGVPFISPFAPKTGSKRPFVLRGRFGMHLRADDYMNSEDDDRIEA